MFTGPSVQTKWFSAWLLSSHRVFPVTRSVKTFSKYSAMTYRVERRKLQCFSQILMYVCLVQVYMQGWVDGRKGRREREREEERKRRKGGREKTIDDLEGTHSSDSYWLVQPFLIPSCLSLTILADERITPQISANTTNQTFFFS